MSLELIAILAVGVAMAGLILNGQNQTNKQLNALEQRMEARVDASDQRMEGRIDALEQRMEGRIDALEQRVSTLELQVTQRFDRLEARLAALEQRVARLEGVLDGLREALFSARAT